MIASKCSGNDEIQCVCQRSTRNGNGRSLSATRDGRHHGRGNHEIPQKSNVHQRDASTGDISFRELNRQTERKDNDAWQKNFLERFDEIFANVRSSRSPSRETQPSKRSCATAEADCQQKATRSFRRIRTSPVEHLKKHSNRGRNPVHAPPGKRRSQSPLSARRLGLSPSPEHRAKCSDSHPSPSPKRKRGRSPWPKSRAKRSDSLRSSSLAYRAKGYDSNRSPSPQNEPDQSMLPPQYATQDFDSSRSLSPRKGLDRGVSSPVYHRTKRSDSDRSPSPNCTLNRTSSSEYHTIHSDFNRMPWTERRTKHANAARCPSRERGTRKKRSSRKLPTQCRWFCEEKPSTRLCAKRWELDRSTSLKTTRKGSRCPSPKRQNQFPVRGAYREFIMKLNKRFCR